MKKIINLTLILLCFNFLAAQDNSGILDKIKNKFNSSELFEANFSQIVNQNSAGNNFKIEGKIYLTKNDQFRIELAKNKIVSNGKTIWNYDGRLDRVIISNFDDEFSAFSINKFLFEYPEKCEVTENGLDRTVLLKAMDNDLPFNEIKIGSNKNYILNLVEILDNTETKYKIKLSNGRFTSEIKKGLFEFEVNENTEIIDLR